MTQGHALERRATIKLLAVSQGTGDLVIGTISQPHGVRPMWQRN